MKPDNSSFQDDRNKKHDFVFKKERQLNEIEIAGFFKISKWFVSHKKRNENPFFPDREKTIKLSAAKVNKAC